MTLPEDRPAITSNSDVFPEPENCSENKLFYFYQWSKTKIIQHVKVKTVKMTLISHLQFGSAVLRAPFVYSYPWELYAYHSYQPTTMGSYMRAICEGRVHICYFPGRPRVRILLLSNIMTYIFTYTYSLSGHFVPKSVRTILVISCTL